MAWPAKNWSKMHANMQAVCGRSTQHALLTLTDSLLLIVMLQLVLSVIRGGTPALVCFKQLRALRLPQPALRESVLGR